MRSEGQQVGLTYTEDAAMEGLSKAVVLLLRDLPRI